MAGPFDMNQQVPMAAIIDAAQKKVQIEAQLRQQQQQDLLQGLDQFSKGMNSVGEMKRRIAAAQTMSQDPSVQASLGAGQQMPAAGPGLPMTPAGPPNQSGVGPAPVEGPRPMGVTPNYTADQIRPLLPRGANADYFGEIQKANAAQQANNLKTRNADRLQQMFNNSGNFVTPQFDAEGGVTGYSTYNAPPGSKLTPPARPRSSYSGAAGAARVDTMKTGQLLTLRKQKADQLSLVQYDPNQAPGLQAEISQLDNEINKRNTYRTGTSTGTGTGDQPPPPAALSKLQEGKPTVFKNGQAWMLRNGVPVRVPNGQ